MSTDYPEEIIVKTYNFSLYLNKVESLKDLLLSDVILLNKTYPHPQHIEFINAESLDGAQGIVHIELRNYGWTLKDYFEARNKISHEEILSILWNISKGICHLMEIMKK
jgi:hypothetical protein